MTSLNDILNSSFYHTHYPYVACKVVGFENAFDDTKAGVIFEEPVGPDGEDKKTNWLCDRALLFTSTEEALKANGIVDEELASRNTAADSMKRWING